MAGGISMYGRWDPGFFSVIAKFAGFSGMMDAQLAIAMQKVGSHLVTVARGNMHWVNPTGALSDSIHMVPSATAVEVGSDLPYAWRREKGFTGMTDSLGRFYTNDPGQYYLTKALIATIPYGEKVFIAAILRALAVP